MHAEGGDDATDARFGLCDRDRQRRGANFGGREKFLEAMPGLVPLGRISRPPEIARLAAFLLSDDAAYVTGHAFVADGGELLVA